MRVIPGLSRYDRDMVVINPGCNILVTRYVGDFTLIR